MKSKKEFDYFDRPAVKRRLWFLLYAVCALSIVPDLLIERHPHFGFDGFIGFYALFGFVSCTILILLSKLIGRLLKVKEGYYDR